MIVMYKKKGFNPDGDDWFWLKYGTNGKVGGCVNCHASVKENDWLFTGAVKYVPLSIAGNWGKA